MACLLSSPGVLSGVFKRSAGRIEEVCVPVARGSPSPCCPSRASFSCRIRADRRREAAPSPAFCPSPYFHGFFSTRKLRIQIRLFSLLRRCLNFQSGFEPFPYRVSFFERGGIFLSWLRIFRLADFLYGWIAVHIGSFHT